MEIFKLCKKTIVLKKKLDNLINNDKLLEQNPIIDSNNNNNFLTHLNIFQITIFIINQLSQFFKFQTLANIIKTII